MTLLSVKKDSSLPGSFIGEDPQKTLFDAIFKKREIHWQSIIFELVKSEQMNPWDIDISLIANRFIKILGKLKEMDLTVPGKAILAAAILLRLKSKRFVSEDILELDRLLAETENSDEDFYDSLEEDYDEGGANYRDSSGIKQPIMPRIPQPRKRKVSVYDLVNALEKALEVQYRRPPKKRVLHSFNLNKKGVDISLIIEDIYRRVKEYYSGNMASTLTFSKLLRTGTREDKVFTFIPLLHLDSQQRVNLMQEESFGEIEIHLMNS